MKRFDKYGNASVVIIEPCVIDKDVSLGANVRIEPFCFIEAGAIIDDGVTVPPFTHIKPFERYTGMVDTGEADRILAEVKAKKEKKR